MDLNRILSWAEIDLDAIAFNVGQIKRHIGPAVEIIAVVKANGYGHGAVQVAQTVLEAGATRLAVHRAVEGVALRQAGIKAPILILGYTPPAAAASVVEHHLTPNLITPEFAQALSGAALATGTTVPVHLKIDTGMNRYGLMPEETLPFLGMLKALPGIAIEGMFTHFATADFLDQSYTLQQISIFKQVLSAARQSGFEIPLVHVCNSAATMTLPEVHFNAVRPGILLYGMSPSDEWKPVFEIRPALTLKSRVSRVRELPAGALVSYGRTYITSKPTRAALVPVGYGDGYHRVLTNKGSVLIHGQRAAIIGRVCMDQFVVDISHIPDVQQDDEVVLIGRQGEGEICADEIGALAGTVNYEVTTSLLPRLTRVYLKDGQISEVNELKYE